VNPKTVLELDKIIHERSRLAIMSVLAATPGMSFTEVRDTLQMSDGNLSIHIKTLQEAGYVAVTKTYRYKKPLTTLALTEQGRKAFTEYILKLDQLVRQSKLPQ
jgi:DNA-binding transcriptional ArsR family regulator